MTESEMAARLVVLEVMFMTTIGIVFTLTGPSDPNHAKALTALNFVRDNAKMRLNETSDPVVIRADEGYLDLLLSELSGGLHSLRPKGG